MQGRCGQLLRANGLVGDPTHPGYTSRTILSGNRSEKTLELGPPLTMQQDDKHACLTECSLVVPSHSAIGETALVDGTPKRKHQTRRRR